MPGDGGQKTPRTKLGCGAIEEEVKKQKKKNSLITKLIAIIRRHINNMKLLLICIFLLSHPLGSIFINVYMFVFLFNNIIYVFLLLRSCILLYVYVHSSCQLAFFGYPD
jgi:hypothetical protein